MVIKHIAFDFGGVIFPLEYDEAVKRFGEIGLVDATQRLNRYTQEGIFGELEKGNITTGIFKDKLQDMCNRSISLEDCQYAWQGYVGKIPVQHLEAVYQLKKKGYETSLLSNTNPFVMSWAKSKNFDGRGNSIDYYMTKLFLSYEMGVLKPDVRIFEQVLEQTHLSSDEILFIDDSKANIEAAKQLGFQTFLSDELSDWVTYIRELLK